MKYFEFRIWTSLIGKFALVVVGDLGPILLNYFCHNWTAVKLRLDFDASFYTLNGFASVNLHHQDESVPILNSKHKYVHLKTPWASHTIHENLAVIYSSSSTAKIFYSIDPWFVPQTGLTKGLHWMMQSVSGKFINRYYQEFCQINNNSTYLGTYS